MLNFTWNYAEYKLKLSWILRADFQLNQCLMLNAEIKLIWLNFCFIKRLILCFCSWIVASRYADFMLLQLNCCFKIYWFYASAAELLLQDILILCFCCWIYAFADFLLPIAEFSYWILPDIRLNLIWNFAESYVLNSSFCNWIVASAGFSLPLAEFMLNYCWNYAEFLVVCWPGWHLA